MVDLLSNSVYMGTDELGLPTRPVRHEDGIYHVEGELQVAPESVLRKTVNMCIPLLEHCQGSNLVFLLPFPRYVCGKCCEDPSHISNFGSEQLIAEINKVPSVARAAISGVGVDFDTISPMQYWLTLFLLTLVTPPPAGSTPST
jgi:hypothetical protein